MKVGPLVEAEDGALLTLKGLFCFSLCILPSFRRMLFKTPAGVLYPWLSTQLPPCLSFLPPLTSGHTSMPTPAFTSPGAALAHLLELLAPVSSWAKLVSLLALCCIESQAHCLAHSA